MTDILLPGKRLESAIRTVTDKCGEIPYTCAEETFVSWQAAGEEIAAAASDGVLRMRASYRVLIFSRGDYEALKIRLYTALLIAGFDLTGMPGEIYNDTTQRHQWPIDVEITYDLVAAYDAIANEEENRNEE